MRKEILAAVALSTPFIGCGVGQRPTVTRITITPTTKVGPSETCQLLSGIQRDIGRVGTSVVTVVNGEVKISPDTATLVEYRFALSHSLAEPDAGDIIPDNEATATVGTVAIDLSATAERIDTAKFDTVSPKSVDNALNQMAIIELLDTLRADVAESKAAMDCPS